MSMQSNLEALTDAARHLTPEDQERLMKALLPPSRSPQQRRITEVRGLGKALWQRVDAQEYLNAKRDSWDN